MSTSKDAPCSQYGSLHGNIYYEQHVVSLRMLLVLENVEQCSLSLSVVPKHVTVKCIHKLLVTFDHTA